LFCGFCVFLFFVLLCKTKKTKKQTYGLFLFFEYSLEFAKKV